MNYTINRYMEKVKPIVFKINKGKKKVKLVHKVVKATKVKTKPKITNKIWESYEMVFKAFLAVDPQRLSYTNMYDFQESWYEAIEKDPKSIYGENVLIVASKEGIPQREFYRATVLKASTIGGALLIDCIIYPNSRQSWKEQDYQANAYQVFPLVKPFIREKTQEEIQALHAQHILDKVNQQLNRERNDLETTKKNLISNVKSYTAQLSGFEKRLKEVEAQLKVPAKESIDFNGLKQMIDSLTKHKKIKWAGIDKNGFLVIETKMLYVIDNKTNKETDVEVGEFAFLVDDGYQSPAVQNLSYACNHKTDYGNDHGSPFQDGTIMCWANQKYNITSYMANYNWYALVDLITLFVAMIHQDAGSIPHIHPDVWLKHRKKKQTPNNWANREFIYTTKDYVKPDAAEEIKVVEPTNVELEYFRMQRLGGNLEAPVMRYGGLMKAPIGVDLGGNVIVNNGVVDDDENNVPF